MIALGTAAEPTTILVPGGATITLRPATTAEHHAAMAAVERIVAAILRGEEAAETAGLDAFALGGDDDLADGLRQHLVAVELGARVILSWTGIGDEDGNPVEPSRAAILALCRDPTVARRITAAALAPYHRRVAEGNASAASPNGAGEAAKTTAEAAEPPASPAPPADAATAAPSAPSASTRRRRARAISPSTSPPVPGCGDEPGSTAP